MYSRFVTTSNVQRFQEAFAGTEKRGASEACWTLIVGDAGHGKTRTAQQWAFDNEAVIVRIPASATPHWVISELVQELGGVPSRSVEACSKTASKLLQRAGRPIVLDEIENAIRGGIACLEVIRDLSDLLEIPVVITGREWVASRLQEQRQIWSRISGIADYRPLTLADIRLLRTQLVECETSDELDPILLEQTGGYIREAVNALSVIDRIGTRTRAVVGPDDIRGVSLVREHVRNMPPPKIKRGRKAEVA
jgi:hypothetical protein